MTTTASAFDLRSEITQMLATAGIESPRAEANLLVRHAGSAARALAARRACREPLQYLIGSTGFRRIEVAVGPGVFIPRPETEVVAGRAMEGLPPGGCVVDVGTGSGAIALSLAGERPDARVLATEASSDAIRWALANRARLGVPVELIECDLMDGLPPELIGHVDVVVSNPPYVAESERAGLPADVVQHEPHVALFGGPDGLDVIERLAGQARSWLRRRGLVVLEIGETQAGVVSALLDRLGYAGVEVMQDLTGRDRVVSATWSGEVAP